MSNKARIIFLKDNIGVSPIISTMLLLVLMLSMISAILMWGTPTIETMETLNHHRNLLTQLESVDADLETILYEGTNVSRTRELSNFQGSINVIENDELWIASFNTVDRYDILFYDFIRNSEL